MFLLPALLLAGCRTLPDTYAPPVQREVRAVTEPSFVGPFISLSNANADAYILKDVSPAVEGGTWRWTYRRPELQFYLTRSSSLRFVLDFALADQTFAETGPVTLAVYVNDRLLDRFRYDKPGVHKLEKPVPPELLRENALNRVVIEPDKVWIAKGDGAALGFILSAAGFQE